MACSSWVDCLVSIRFDLDIGPKIESISPPDAITEEGKVKLLHCAFPDCNPDCGYNFIFYFTMPDCTTVAAQSFSQTVAPPTTGNTVPELYGAAFYRQKHDPNVPRRYVQQVVVLLSHLPYYNVHELILRVVAPRFCQCCALSPDTGKVPVSSVMSPFPESYFEVDQSYTPQHYTQEEVLRDAMQELSQWPSPHPQVRYSVTLLQQALVFLTPAHSLRQSIRATRSSCAAVRRSMDVDSRVEFMELARDNARYRGSSFGNDVLPLFSLLGEQLHHLTYVWELLLRHEPLLILSNTPCVASATAFSVASLILPIQFNGTLRSYFTVQNEDFSRLSRMGKALPFPTHEALIVAGTNPFLLRSFSGWPSLLVVMDRNAAHAVNGSVASAASTASLSLDARSPAGLGHGSLARHSSATSPVPRTMLLEELRAETPPLPPAQSTSPHHGAAHAGGSSGSSNFPVSSSILTTTNSATTTTTNHTATQSAGDGMSNSTSFMGSSDNSTSNRTVNVHNMSSNNGAAQASASRSATTSAVPQHTHADGLAQRPLVTMVPSSAAGSGVALSALVQTPSSKPAAPTSDPTTYTADPHAAYALESSTDESHSRSTSASSTSRPSTPPPPPPPTAAADGPSARDAGERDSDRTATASPSRGADSAGHHPPQPHHLREGSSHSTNTASSSSGLAGGAGAPLSASSRRHDADVHSGGGLPSPSAVPAAMPPPSASSVTLFTLDNYRTTVESVQAADYRKRGGGHQDTSRTNLQQRLHNYFDSSVHFLLNHAEQSKTLLKRLEMVSLLDADAQRTSVSLSLNQWQGSPTTVSSPWRRTGSSGQTSPPPASSSFPRQPVDVAPTSPTRHHNGAAAATSSSPPHVARTGGGNRHRDPTTTEHGVTSCSHFSVADDMLRKFFTSLTTEFLTPVTSWYHKVTAPYTAFHLCDRAMCDSLLSPASFLSDFAQRHRETAPLMWTQLHSYKTYKVIYERFASGCLFKAYVCQLLEEDLRRQLNSFQIEDWVVRVPSEAERIDLLINLLNTIQRELNETLDPDVLFVTTATSVMASMAVGLREPHREQFMLKIVDLKL